MDGGFYGLERDGEGVDMPADSETAEIGGAFAATIEMLVEQGYTPEQARRIAAGHEAPQPRTGHFRPGSVPDGIPPGPMVWDEPSLDEVDGRLLWVLRKAGDEWGPLGVALTAAELLDDNARQVLIRKLTKHDD
jgi:hypothetical protein